MSFVVGVVEQEVQVVVEVHVQEEHEEVVQHVVEDREGAAVELWMDEDQVQPKGQGEEVELTMSEQPYQNLLAPEVKSSMWSGAKSS